MTRMLPTFALLFASTPISAQGIGEGLDQVGEGAGQILRGLVDEARPAVTGAVEGVSGIAADLLPTFRLLAQEMGPAFVEVFGDIDSIEYYDPPVITPEGDIVLRRRPDAPTWEPQPTGRAESGPTGQASSDELPAD
jgi:hypothetical protein